MSFKEQKLSEKQCERLGGVKGSEWRKYYDEYEYLSKRDIGGLINKERLINNGGIKVTYHKTKGKK